MAWASRYVGVTLQNRKQQKKTEGRAVLIGVNFFGPSVRGECSLVDRNPISTTCCVSTGRMSKRILDRGSLTTHRLLTPSLGQTCHGGDHYAHSAGSGLRSIDLRTITIGSHVGNYTAIIVETEVSCTRS